MPITSVLVVEDESITALDLRARLVRSGYAVPGIASSGEEAIGKAGELRPDVVLMDIHLSGSIDGIAAAGAVRTDLNIPVVFLTAYSDDETLQRAMGAGPYGYLVKPFSERELRTTIEVALDKHRKEMVLQANERQLRLYARRLEILHEIDRAILACWSPEAIAGATVRHILALIPCHCVSVTALDQAGSGARLLAALPAGQVTAGQPCQALHTGAPGHVRLVEDLRAVSDVSEAEGLLLCEGIRAYMEVPLSILGEPIGALNLCSKEPGAFDRGSLEIAQEVADSLALAIHHADLQAQVEQRAAELEVRNAELDAFASTVAHDLQHPLGLIVGFADALEESWSDMAPEVVQRNLDIISRTGSRMSRIIHELLLLVEVRKQDVNRVELDMGQIVANALELLDYMIQQQHAEISVPDRSAWPAVLGHAPWVEEVWVNYLSNAIKYGGRPPRVELGAAAQPADGIVRFWVRDRGPGILPEDQPRLFTPFTQLAQVRAGGHGLGLSIVRLIVEKLNGQVGVESAGVPGQGSVFSFTLPAKSPAALPRDGGGRW